MYHLVICVCATFLTVKYIYMTTRHVFEYSQSYVSFAKEPCKRDDIFCALAKETYDYTTLICRAHTYY